MIPSIEEYCHSRNDLVIWDMNKRFFIPRDRKLEQSACERRKDDLAYSFQYCFTENLVPATKGRLGLTGSLLVLRTPSCLAGTRPGSEFCREKKKGDNKAPEVSQNRCKRVAVHKEEMDVQDTLQPQRFQEPIVFVLRTRTPKDPRYNDREVLWRIQEIVFFVISSSSSTTRDRFVIGSTRF